MKIKISGFPDIVTVLKIDHIFSDFGTVSHVEKEQHKNVAYVTMPHNFQALNAILSLNGTKLLGHMVEVEECL